MNDAMSLGGLAGVEAANAGGAPRALSSKWMLRHSCLRTRAQPSLARQRERQQKRIKTFHSAKQSHFRQTTETGLQCRKSLHTNASSPAKAQQGSWLLSDAMYKLRSLQDQAVPSAQPQDTQSPMSEQQATSAKSGLTGSQAKEAPLCCFPEEFQLPGLHSKELQGLLDDLSTKVAQPETPKPAPDDLSAITKALQQALAMPSADRGSLPPAPVQASITRTTNGAATYSSSGSARTDLFFKCEESGLHAHETIPQELLDQAWNEDPLDTLKLIAHLRDVRDGKAEQKAFRLCVKWLYEKHPLTLIENLPEIVKVGYWKDLLDILVRACVSKADMEARVMQQTEAFLCKKKGSKYPALSKIKEDHPELCEMTTTTYRKYFRSLKSPEARAEAKRLRAQQVQAKDDIINGFYKDQKQAKKKNLKHNAVFQYSEEPLYRLLHISVAAAFAQQLQLDSVALKEKRLGDISLAAKWAPTPAKSHDKDTFIASSIAELLFPASLHKKPNESRVAYVIRVRERYRKTILVPLRKCLDVPEVYMCANAWGDVNYSRVASVCMHKNKTKFERHDKERFDQYLADVEAGKKKIASGALKPHELVQQAMKSSHTWVLQQPHDPDYSVDSYAECSYAEGDAEDLNLLSQTSMRTMELQWQSYVDKLKEAGSLSNALAICDVSASMYGLPMEVAIALSLLVTQVTAPPFHNTVCTFSATPQLHEVVGGSLVKKVVDLAGMDWGGNTDLNAAFNLVLQRACDAKLPPEQMLDTIFIFSDMQFDQATSTYDWRAGQCSDKTNFHQAQDDFAQHGYKLPKVVFWNLRGPDMGETASVPVTCTEEGTALVSGFSGQLLKLFMGGVNELESYNPFNIMKEAIAADKYDGWRVVD